MTPRTNRQAHAPRRPRSSLGGYTMVEVMMAMALLTAGAAGIFALQQAAINGNAEARQMSIATTITRSWLERLKRDALNWNIGGTVAAALPLVRTRYLLNVPAVGTAPTWMTPAVFSDSRSSYDNYGREIALGADVRYCAQYRLEWVNAGQAMRADVRVWWHRRGAHVAATANLYPNCGVGSETIIGNDIRVRTVSASTVIRWVSR